MAVTIDATVGGASANSFVTEVEADAYLEARLNASAWTGSNKAVALVEATRELNTRDWAGRKATDTQSLLWPRQWAPDPDGPSCGYLSSSVIPQRIKDATCELALEFLKAGSTDLAAQDPNAGVIEKTVDVLTTRWQPYQRPTSGLARFPRIMALIAPLLASSGLTVQTVRG